MAERAEENGESIDRKVVFLSRARNKMRTQNFSFFFLLTWASRPGISQLKRNFFKKVSQCCHYLLPWNRTSLTQSYLTSYCFESLIMTSNAF